MDKPAPYNPLDGFETWVYWRQSMALKALHASIFDVRAKAEFVTMAEAAQALLIYRREVLGQLQPEGEGDAARKAKAK